MKSMIALMALVSTVLTGVTSHAQTTRFTVEIDIQGVICALLPQDLQNDCGRDTHYSETSQKAVEFCGSLFMPDSKQECYSQIRGRFYSSTALDICSGTLMDDSKLACLSVIPDAYFQNSAVEVCRGVFMPDDKTECLESIKNRVYERYETDACKKEFMPDSQIACIKNLGRDLRWSDRAYGNDNRRNPNPRIIMIEENTRNYGNRNDNRYETREEKCDVHNSNNTFLATINKKQFANYAAIKAREANSCVVTSILGETSSRTLFDRDGRVVGRSLTEDQARSLKHSRGMDRCRVLVCR